MRKCFLTTFMAVLLALSAMAQSNRVYIEDFEIEPGSTVTVPMILANETPTRGMQCNITLPPGLTVEDCTANEYSLKLNMTLLSNFVDRENCYTILMYPYSRVGFPAGTNEVLTITFKAQPDFKGGTMKFWKCRGSNEDNTLIVMDDVSATVTVPLNIMNETNSTGDGFFQLNNGF